MFSRILAVLIAGIAGASTAHAEPASRWVKQAASSPMDQSETVTFKRKADVPVTDSLGRKSYPQLILRCWRAHGGFGSVKVLVQFENRLFTSAMGNNHVRVRFDEGAVENQVWSPSTDGTYLFWEPEALDKLRSAKTLHVEFAPPLSNAQYTKFTLAGSADAVDGVLDPCTMPAEDREAYDAEQLPVLKANWLRELADHRAGKAYDLAYNFLVSRGRIEGPSFKPVIGSSSAPKPAEEVFERLMAYMNETGLCIYASISACPTTFAESVQMEYMTIGFSRVSPESNLAWNPRARFLKTAEAGNAAKATE